MPPVPCPAPADPLQGVQSSWNPGAQKVFCDIAESTEGVRPTDGADVNPRYGGAHRGRQSVRAIQRAHLKRLTDASSNSAAFWKVYRGMADPKPRPPAVLLSDLAACFEKRMNAPDPPPPEFNAEYKRVVEQRAESIPNPSVEAGDPLLDDRLSEEDLACHLRSHYNTSVGLDKASYREVAEIENDKLCTLINECIDRNDAPSVWLTTLIAAIGKKDKPLSDANSYRTIGLESCFLKLICLLIHRRIYMWAEKHGIIPPSQNGFREGYRTNNNGFILRCMIERARAEGRTLWVAFMDITNAFPSTNRDLLWVKLYEMGVKGKLFDWMRMLYGRMEYVVTKDGTHSNPFTSDIGVLTGDPASPTFWDLFFADFKLHPDPDDVLLLNIVMSHLEHADDMAIVSYSSEGLRHHLKTFERWCGNNFLQANASKSWIMVFGAFPRPLPSFTLYGLMIQYTDCFCYVGLTFQSTSSNIFSSHYAHKATVARRTGFTVLGVESYIGNLPPKEGRILYMACVDPHLVSGADVVIDSNPKLVESLEKVQTAFLRRLLGLGAYSMRAPLFTELGLIPLSYRRIILALRYVGYLVDPKTSPYARAALEDSYNLYLNSHQGYWMDLALVMSKLRYPVALPGLTGLTPDLCADLAKEVHKSALKHLDGEVQASTRLYLLHDRLEPLKDEAPQKITLILRHYLELVRNPNHRKAITRLLVSQHPLAIERMRYKSRYHRVEVPRDLRVCRFGCREIESVEHALFFCKKKTELVECRRGFVNAMQGFDPTVLTVAPWNATRVLRGLIFRRDTVCQVAKYAYKVFAIFNGEVMVWPRGY